MKKEYKKAIEYYKESFEIFLNSANHMWEGITLNTIGVAYYYLADNDKAIEHFNKSLKVFNEIGNQVEEGKIRRSIGRVYFSGTGNWRMIKKCLRKNKNKNETKHTPCGRFALKAGTRVGHKEDREF